MTQDIHIYSQDLEPVKKLEAFLPGKGGEQRWQFFRQAVNIVNNGVIVFAKDAFNVSVRVWIQRQAVG
jgi:hypothetical protein